MKRILLFLGAALCLSYTIAQPTAGLVAYWPLNGNFTDNGPNNISVTNTSVTATTNAAGIINSAMSFNNPTSTVASYATITSNAAINFTGDFSIDFSFYINSPYVHGMGFFDNGINPNSANAYGYGVWFWNVGFNQLAFNFRNGSVQSTAAANIQLATWTHATFVRAAGVLKIYINGVLNNSGAEGSTTIGYTGVIPKIGTMTYLFQTPQGYNGLHGKMDELRVYNRALTQAEITTLATLPIKLSSFTASKNNSDILLQWQTQYEQNSDHFNLQRSTDGANFINIGSIKAKGNSSLVTNYQFTDNTVKNLGGTPVVFYRLESVDLDGRREMSPVVNVKLNTVGNELVILENPVRNDLRLQFRSMTKENTIIMITDIAGRQVLTKQLQVNMGVVSTTIPVNMLQAGQYYITVVAGEDKQTLPFIKQ